MKVLLDTNIILDFLLMRPPHDIFARDILRFSRQGFFQTFITASSATDIFYLAKKTLKDLEVVYELFENLLKTVSIIQVDNKVIENAIKLHWKDFEDAVQYVAATYANVDYIVTRNKSDFELAEIQVVEPNEFLLLPWEE